MHANQLRQIAANPAAFRSVVLIDSDAGPVRLSEVLDPWQRLDFEALDAGWLRVAGKSIPGDSAGTAPMMRAFFERPRGHSKTSDLAVMVIWALVFSRRTLSGAAAAADKDQAKLLRDSIEKIIRLNPWLAETLECQALKVVNTRTGSALEILSSDAATSYGLNPDFLVIDELTHWKGRDLWDSLISAAAKRGHCMVVVISNAGLGMGTSWQWEVRERCRQADNWHFSRLDGPKASWITPDRLNEQRQLLPGKAFNRLWLNLWTVESGDALDASDIEGCITLPGPAAERNQNYEYIAALDLGIKHDHSALAVLGLDLVQRQVNLVHCESWSPAQFGGKVRLSDVQNAVMDLHQRFGLCGVYYDPWQAELMAEQLQAAGLWMIGVPFTAKNLDVMATTLLQMFRNRQVNLYRDDPLIRDLCRLTIVERQQGFRLQATRDETGHCDRATALAMVLPHAMTAIDQLLSQLNEDSQPAYVLV
jgi:phage terminase large subunit-like protein